MFLAAEKVVVVRKKVSERILMPQERETKKENHPKILISLTGRNLATDAKLFMFLSAVLTSLCYAAYLPTLVT